MINETVCPCPSLEDMMSILRTACIGLTYISETDSTVAAFQSYRIAESLTPTAFKQAMKLPPLASVENFDFETFFARLILPENDPEGKWSVIYETLSNSMVAVAVYKIPRAIRSEKDVFAFCHHPDGYFVGIKTFAVET